MRRTTFRRKAHPLILRLREIAGWHKMQAKMDLRSRKATPHKFPCLRAFYQDAARLHREAARMIMEAIRLFPVKAMKKGGAK